MQDLAAACGVNSWQSIQQWESGKTSPKLGRFTRLAKALGVSESELLGDASGSKSLNMREADKKKSRITDEHREESRRLKAIYDQRKADGRLKMTQAQIGAEYGIGTQAMVGHCLSGRAAMTLPTAVAWAKLLCCEVADFSPRLAAKQIAPAPVQCGNGPQGEGSTAQVAEALRITVRAIAERWQISPEDLLDPSPEARQRVEDAISSSMMRPPPPR